MPAILGLFNILSLIYVFRSLQLGVVIGREWRSVKQDPLTRRKKHLAEQAAFFIAVPLGVFLHELGHALAVWLFGGQVVEFGYRVFWGYVLPSGQFTPGQDWFIGLAGTLGSLLFGVGIWVLLRRSRSSALRYFGLRALRFQVYFSTIYYPVFTLLGFEGDWRTIYDFQATPLLSGLTAPFHLGLVGLFWWGDRKGWFERPSFATQAEQTAFARLRQEAAVSPHDTQLKLQLVDVLRRGGATNTARRRLDSFLKQNPDSGAGHLQLALLQYGNKGQLPPKASKTLRRALQLGLPNPDATVLAHQLLAQYELDRDHGKAALSHLDQAIAAWPSRTGRERQRAELHYMRGLAHRRQGQLEHAYQEVQQALSMAQKLGDDDLRGRFAGELEIIEKHAGRSFGAGTPRGWEGKPENEPFP